MRSFILCALSVAVFAACSDDGGKTPDAPPGNQLSCSAYCTTIAANCTAANAQYGGADATATCMANCAKFPMGTAADMSGNTLGCRNYHAGAAMTNPGVHCTHAGPGGAGMCGDNCLGFCNLVQTACTGANPSPYADMGACMTACGGFATTPAYSAMTTSGNSFACRLYHATQAVSLPAPHCMHVGAVSPTCQ
jgi:hypothetical protein